MLTQIPGFHDRVHDAQRTFRSLLNALARPGIPQNTADISPPAGMYPSCAAACLTLLDLETTIWLQPTFPESVQSWLLFHTGCQFTTDPKAADFAVLSDLSNAPKLDEFQWGSSEFPESSTSLLVQLPALRGGEQVVLEGPGIFHSIAIDLPLPSSFWAQWKEVTAAYPMGVDCWWFADQVDQVVGLPRTSRLVSRQRSSS